MGGYGSGIRNYGFKTLVEDCLSIGICTLTSDLNRVDSGGGIRYGSIYWTRNGKRIGDIGYQVFKKNSIIVVYLNYKTTNRITGEEKEFEYPVRVQYTKPYFGGKRYWFTCPLVINGKACQRRVGKLYQPPGGDYFGCRHCYDLVYLSSRESHKWDSMWKRLGVDPRIGKRLEMRDWLRRE